MSVILKMTVKERGTILWPPEKEPDGIANLRKLIVEKAEETRTVMGTLPTTRVYVNVTFRPDIMVDP